MRQNRVTKRQSGFTLVELVIVIGVLGILAAVAVPKFINIKGDAETAALSGIAGGIDGANSVNVAIRSQLGKGQAVTTSDTCATAVAKILVGGTPAGYTVNTDTLTAGDNTCTITQTSTSDTTDVTISTTE